ncbi:hypothetical protein MYX75_02035 [Acidobacteria bacterium AH-259-A15]|nr:hypothetical protein [Acidobacteria bacterium AH-259-A15]
MPTPREVAEWMLQELKRQESLYQEEAVYEIEHKFGAEFVYENENGNPAISRKVLKEFRELTEETVVWERSERMWRFRESYDSAGRLAE